MYTYKYVYAYIYIYIYLHTYVYIYVYVYLFICICLRSACIKPPALVLQVRDVFTFVTWLIHMCDMTHLCVWKYPCIYVKWFIHICGNAHSYVWYDSFTSHVWKSHESAPSCSRSSFKWKASCYKVWLKTWLIDTWDMTRPYTEHHSSICMTLLIHTRDTGWRRAIKCLKLQVNFRKRATNYRALLRKATENVMHPMALRHPVWHSFRCVKWLMTQLDAWNDSFIRATQSLLHLSIKMNKRQDTFFLQL